MKGDVEAAALILGACVLLHGCAPKTARLKIDSPNLISKEYCAGLKTGEALKEILP